MMRSGSQSCPRGSDPKQLCPAHPRAGTARYDPDTKSSCARSGGTRNGCKRTREDANIKLTETISDIRGQSGRAILRALIAWVD